MEDNDGDKSEEDSDLDIGSVSNSEKEANRCLRVRPLSTEKDHSLTVFQTKVQKKTKADSQKLIDEFRDKHLQEMSKGNRRRHCVRALMACHVNKKATVWQTHFTPFFLSVPQWTCPFLTSCQPPWAFPRDSHPSESWRRTVGTFQGCPSLHHI